MTDAELDGAYTALCEAMSAVGEDDALPLLGRFALLAMLEINDAARIDAIVAKAVASAANAPPA